MVTTWYPDFCPNGGQCQIEIKPDFTGITNFKKRCPFHQINGLSDHDTFVALVQSSKLKEAARWAIRLELGLDKDAPQIPYTVESDGSFTIHSGVTGVEHARVRDRVNASMQDLPRSPGTSQVRII